MLILRKTEALRARPFRMPAAIIICPAAIIGCIGLFLSLEARTQIFFFAWMAVGLVVYFVFSRGSSVLAK